MSKPLRRIRGSEAAPMAGDRSSVKMALSCGATCIKYLLFLFNLLFVVAAVALIAIGVLVHTAFSSYLDFFSDLEASASAFIVAVGAFILIVASLGCCGAAKENRLCVGAFGALLVLVFVLELSAGVAAFVLRARIGDEMATRMRDSESFFNKSEGATATWDELQLQFDCCGAENYTEWFGRLGDRAVPDSCCRNFSRGCGRSAVSENNVHALDCLTGFTEWVADHVLVLGAAGLGLALTQTVGVVFACHLVRALGGRHIPLEDRL